jgi:hypothetical protein
MNDGYDRRVLTTQNNSFIVQATMATDDPSVSPVIDTTRFGFIAVENIINNLPLLNTGFIITSGGSGYANSSDVTVTISGGNGSGATAIANVNGLVSLMPSHLQTLVLVTQPHQRLHLRQDPVVVLVLL